MKGTDFKTNTNTKTGTPKLFFDHPDADSFKFRVRRYRQYGSIQHPQQHPSWLCSWSLDLIFALWRSCCVVLLSDLSSLFFYFLKETFLHTG